MPAYYRATLQEFVTLDVDTIVGQLQRRYANDGFASQYTRQTRAWADSIPLLQQELRSTAATRPEANDWSVLLEYPLYRLRRRIDVVLLAGNAVIVIECKVGAYDYPSADRRQVEEYALDLRDFHADSRNRVIIPVLWSTRAQSRHSSAPRRLRADGGDTVHETVGIGSDGLAEWLGELEIADADEPICPRDWDAAPYRPVPSVIEAATTIFAGHEVRNIANADADNLRCAAARLIRLIESTKRNQRYALMILTGVPGSGKTLAGLDVVHSAVAAGVEDQGDIVYLSGNTPLVTVLREALASDEAARRRATGESFRLEDVRRSVRARIQHINDFLKQYVVTGGEPTPHEHVIVFDEAQRAWDREQGQAKFSRDSSEPALLLEIMSRHADWCACICLVGGGQEINSGEEGVLGWGEALRQMDSTQRGRWSVFAPPDVLRGGPTAGSFSLGDIPSEFTISEEVDLQLRVPLRSFRSPNVSRWVDRVLAGDWQGAFALSQELGNYPILVTRGLEMTKDHLRRFARGERRVGLVASSGARRLRAEGLGYLLNASAGDEIAHWYLQPPGDIRSSFQLEVPANEYACQGLELDYTGVCWGGDLLWDPGASVWQKKRLHSTAWQLIRDPIKQKFLENSYRVLLTRAREGMVVWVPEGSTDDETRAPSALQSTADFLIRCGAKSA